MTTLRERAQARSSMTLGKRSTNFLLLQLAAVLITICSLSNHRKYFGAAAMTIDEAILAAATASRQESASQSMPMFSLQSEVELVELDMLFRREDLAAIKGSGEGSSIRCRRNALRKEQFRWPNAEIPYQLSLRLSTEELRNFSAALGDYHRFTCLRFRQATETDRAYVNIVNGVGCYSYVGRLDSDFPQELSLGAGCRHKSTIIHELAHSIGLNHEHTRPDRDDFVIIRKENIDNGTLQNFDKYSTDLVDTRGIPYDYLSLMHYGQYFFSNNGKETVVTKNATYQNLIGNAPGLSFRDVKLANVIYSCSERNRCRKKTCPSEGFVGQDCQCWCPSGNSAIAAMRCPGCNDYNNFCDFFMKHGMCTKRLYADYLKDVCPKACGVCI